jgi:hypothetical protein
MLARAFMDSYWRPETEDTVFVAMQFANMAAAWEEIFKPAIEVDLCPANPGRLRALRADSDVISEPIMMRIHDGIAHSRLVVADLTGFPRKGRAVRRPNPNVMYEVGLAHVVREPEEVLLVRGNDYQLPFDLRGVCVHEYDGSNMPKARQRVAELLRDSLEAVDETKSLRVKAAMVRLDDICERMINERKNREGFSLEPIEYVEQLVWLQDRMAATKLVELGIVRWEGSGESPGDVYFRWTPFGQSVIEALENRDGRT